MLHFMLLKLQKKNDAIWINSDDSDIQPEIELISMKHFAYSAIQNVYDDD